MKPEDQAVFEAEFAETLGDYPRNWALRGFQTALAHRDAQPAVAVNEQMLEALKDLLEYTGFTGIYSEKASAAIAAADAAKGGAV